MPGSSSVYRYSKIEHALLQHAWMSEGRSDAFTLAVKCHADVSCIQAEIESEEASIQEALTSTSFGNHNPMSPGASCSTGTGRAAPTGRTSPSWRARSTRTWKAGEVSPISSRNRVPPWARWKRHASARRR